MSLLVQNNSINKKLANINIFRMMDFSAYLREYHNIRLFERPCSAFLTMLSFMFVLLIIVFVISAIVYMVRYPFSSIALRGLEGKAEICISKVLARMNFTGIEIYKIVFRKKKYIFIIALLMVEIFLIKNTKINFPERQVQMDEVYSKYGGSDWESSDLYVEGLKAELNDIENRHEEINNTLEDSENRLQKIEEISSLEFLSNEIIKKLEEYEKVQEYHKNSEITKNVNTYAMSNRGYDEIIGSNSYIRELGILISSVLLITVLSSGLFLEERNFGVLKIVKSSYSGLKKIYRKKYIIFFAIIILLAALVYGIDIVSLNNTYNLPYMEAPLLSISFMEKKISSSLINITIKQFLYLDVIYKLLICYATMVIAVLFSKSNKVNSLFFVPIVALVMGVIGGIGILASVMVKIIIAAAALGVVIVFSVYILGGCYKVNDK